MFSCIQRKINCIFRSSKQQSFSYRIFSYCINGFDRQSVDNFFPTKTSVGGFINMWRLVIASNSIHSNISGIVIKSTGINHRNFTPSANTWRRNIFPMLTSIFGNMNVSIIGARPYSIDVFIGRG